MPYNSVVISSGHGKYVAGASGYLNEVQEARLVVDRVGALLRDRAVTVKTFHDDTSHSVDTNLATIVNYHNSQSRQLDVSVHFNASQTTNNPVGTEVWWYTQETLARQVATRIANQSGLKDRGPKYSSGLYFLRHTAKPSILIEVCFVDSSADAEIYRMKFEGVCDAIADMIGREDAGTDPVPPDPPANDVLFKVSGSCSWFGGPDDTGVSPSEGLAFIYEIEDAPHLFLPYQPTGTTGLARRLNPNVMYVACRWDYDVTPKPTLLKHMAKVRNPESGFEVFAYPADWGPNTNTGRVCDVSPAILKNLGVTTDDTLEVIYPVEGDI